MIPNDDKISTYQLGVLIFNIILGVGIFSFPAGLAEAVENDAWIVGILSGFINLIFIYFMCKIGNKYADLGLIGTIRKVFGNVLGTIIAIPALVYFVVFGAIAMRIFAETVKVYLLNNTPLEFIILPLMFLAVFLVRSGIEPISRFFEIVTPIIAIVMIYLIIVALPKSDFSNLRPYMTHPVSAYVEGLRSGAFSFAGFEVLLIIFPFLRKPKKAFKASVVTMLLITVLYTIMTVLCLTRLGAKETAAQIYPTVTLIKVSQVPGGFIERQEGVLLAIWVIFVYTTIVGMIYASSVIAGDILYQRERKHAVSILIPILYVLSLFGENVAELGKLADMLNITFGAYTIAVLPIILVIVSAIRDRGGAKDEG